MSFRTGLIQVVLKEDVSRPRYLECAHAVGTLVYERMHEVMSDTTSVQKNYDMHETTHGRPGIEEYLLH
jgi:hypothetical protein